MQANRVLDFPWWLVSWRRYGIAAVAAEQLTFAAVVTHENIVAEVVALGAAEGYGSAIGPLYSECER